MGRPLFSISALYYTPKCAIACAMEAQVCSLCQKPKASAQCGLCGGPVCKKCLEKLPENHFSYLESVPPELSHTVYCGRCFDASVAQPLQNYDQLMEKAKAVFVFYRGQGEETRLMRRTEAPISIDGIADRAETLMRLAFRAVEAGFNTLVDVDILATKVRNEGYQTTKWKGIGTPTLESAERIHAREASQAR